MRQTDDTRPEDSAPHKVPGALRAPVPRTDIPTKSEESDDDQPTALKETTSGFSSFES